MKSQVLSLRLKPEQMERLQKLARRADRKPSELAARLIEEALRMAEFPSIEFRDTIIGRQAYVKGSRIAPWFLEVLARSYNRDIEQIAAHLNWPDFQVKGGLAYAEAFPEEIEAAITENDSYDEERFKREFLQGQVFRVSEGQTADGAEVGATRDVAPAAR
ncbi:MAG: transcriptional regulator [Chloroflexia bacterium]